MSRNRVIYNVEGVFVGPAPATGYHFIDTFGVVHNDPNRIDSYNLVVPIHRVTNVAYNFAAERTEIRAFGKRGTIANPILAPPTINLSIDYHQAGVLNEARFGFFTNYSKPPYVLYSGEPYYKDNFNVFLLSGFITDSMECSDTPLGWPLSYRDKRNLFLAIGKDQTDLNSQNTSVTRESDVVAFGNCYLTNYKSSAAVGQTAKGTVSYVAENMCFYSSGSGVNIPALNYNDGTTVSGVVFKLPSLYEGPERLNVASVIVPGDIILNFKNYPDNTGRYAHNGLVSGGYTGRGNLCLYSEQFSSWEQVGTDSTENAYRFWSDILPNQNVDKIQIVGTDNFSQCAASYPFSLESGLSYDLSVYLKTGNVSYADFGIWNYGANTWLSLGRFFISGASKSASYYLESYATDIYVQPQEEDWVKCGIKVTAPSGMSGQFQLFPNRWDSQAQNDYIAAFGAQVRRDDWPEGYLKTSNMPITGVPRNANIFDLGVDFHNLTIQDYSVDLALRREPQYAINFKLPADRKVGFPVYANLRFSMLVNDLTTGSIAHLIEADKNYDITIKLDNPASVTGQGRTALRYDFFGAKFQDISYQTAIGDNKTCSLTFVSELDPDFKERGMFMSGVFGMEDPHYQGGYYLIEGTADDGFRYLNEDGSAFRTEDFAIVSIY